MACSAQKVETAPRGASSGHCAIASRTRGSMGSWAATAEASRCKCHHQDDPKRHRCCDPELSPMSWEMRPGPEAAGLCYRTPVLICVRLSAMTTAVLQTSLFDLADDIRVGPLSGATRETLARGAW